jgi:nucleoside 2-deoxyribosyltransferase
VSEANPIRVFVSHTFQESDDYLRVFEFLESADRFFYLNCSKPENVPQTGGLEAIKDELIAQIKECEAVIILASQYIEQNDLTKYQMDVAAANDKPIIAIRPVGGVVETPQELIDRADEHIGWNDREMVDSLKRLARMEDTSRWETIEFTLD